MHIPSSKYTMDLFILCIQNKKFLSLILLLFLTSSCTYLRETPSYREQPVRTNSPTSPIAHPSPPSDRGFYNEYSQRLGYNLVGTENPGLIQEIESWLGTPYRLGGNTKEGVDCSGFAHAVYQKIYGINLARISVNMAQNSVRVDRKRLQEGDLVFFKIDRRNISHVGIYLGNNKFVHASSSRGVIISDLDEKYYAERFAFGGRVRD
jgi:murein DD-endopeptidase / murein LD-carboxypeptidase